MDWTKLASDLDSAFTIPKVTLPAAVILGRRRPLNLGRLLRRSATSEEERYDAEDNACGKFTTRSTAAGPLLEFEWESGGPMSSFVEVSILDVQASRVFICVYGEVWADEGDACRIVAAIGERTRTQISAARVQAVERDEHGRRRQFVVTGVEQVELAHELRVEDADLAIENQPSASVQPPGQAAGVSRRASALNDNLKEGI